MSRVEVAGLAQELQQGDGESGGADGMSDEYRAEVFVDAHLKLAKIRLGGEGRRVEVFESLGYAFGLRAREAPLFEFLDDAIGRVSEYYKERDFQRKADLARRPVPRIRAQIPMSRWSLQRTAHWMTLWVRASKQGQRRCALLGGLPGAAKSTNGTYGISPREPIALTRA